jgi:hypothetical protein
VCVAATIAPPKLHGSQSVKLTPCNFRSDRRIRSLGGQSGLALGAYVLGVMRVRQSATLRTSAFPISARSGRP